MTLREMTEKYMAANNLRIVKGGTDDIAILMPYFLMDAGYQYYCKVVKPLKLAQEAKRARSRWAAAYLAFNRRLTNSFLDPAERCEVTDLMDEFEEAIANDLLITQVAGMTCFQDEFNFEQQKILSAIMMTNILAVCAQTMWRTLYYGRESVSINGVLQWSKTTADYYMGGLGLRTCLVKQSRVDHLNKCNETLCNKIILWIKRKNEEL